MAFINVSIQLYEFRNVTAVRVEIIPVSDRQGEQASQILSEYVSSNFTTLGQRLVSVENHGVSRVVHRCELKICVCRPHECDIIVSCYGIQQHVPAFLMYQLLSSAQDPGPVHVDVQHKGIAKSVYYVPLTFKA